MSKSQTRKLTKKEEKYLDKLIDECGWRVTQYVSDRRKAIDYDIRHVGCRSYPNCEDDPGGCNAYRKNNA